MYSVKVYSIGAGNEGHGPAIPSNIDDLFAKRTAVLVSEKLGLDYRGHLPYCGDRVGDIARDWNPCYMPSADVLNGIIKDIKEDIERFKGIPIEKFSHVIIISGHGGNNFLKGLEKTISDELKLPVLYIPPLEGVTINHPFYGLMVPTHADDCEHSIAMYMNVLDKEGFEELNKLAGQDINQVFERWPIIMGFSGYMNGKDPRYDPLRSQANVDMLKRFLQNKHISANAEIGRDLFERNIDHTVMLILDFIEKKK